jgi:hypothetical protein
LVKEKERLVNAQAISGRSTHRTALNQVSVEQVSLPFCSQVRSNPRGISSFYAAAAIASGFAVAFSFPCPVTVGHSIPDRIQQASPSVEI